MDEMMTLEQVRDRLAQAKTMEYSEQKALANAIDERIKGDGGAVGSMRALLIKALTDYRCTRTVDEDGEPLPLVDALSPGEGGTIQSGTEEIEFLAEYLADELPLPTPHPARSGVVSDEDVRDAARLDWVAMHAYAMRSALHGRRNAFVWGPHYPIDGAGVIRNLRASIDAARKGERHER